MFVNDIFVLNILIVILVSELISLVFIIIVKCFLLGGVIYVLVISWMVFMQVFVGWDFEFLFVVVLIGGGFLVIYVFVNFGGFSESDKKEDQCFFFVGKVCSDGWLNVAEWSDQEQV